MEFDFDDTVAVKLKSVEIPKRTKPHINVDPATARKLSQDYDVLPSYENRMADYIHVKHYSLKTNEFLKYQFEVYKSYKVREPRMPVQFLQHKDFHFHNCNIKYRPEESMFRRTNVPFKLKTGPGIDNLGQIPIADDFFYKRFDTANRKYPKKHGQEKGRDGKK